MYHDTTVLLFAMTAGFTASGIAANLYRLLIGSQKDRRYRTIYYASLVIAGPSMLFENAAQMWRKKDCTWVTFWLAAAVAGYWSLALGLLAIQLLLAV